MHDDIPENNIGLLKTIEIRIKLFPKKCSMLLEKGGNGMYEWNAATQKMLDWLEEHLTDNPTLLEMSRQIGYSPCYCSSRFHSIVGMTVKNYISSRRLTRAALEIRDTKDRILDIALRNGYSSQEALTRAFAEAYGCTPAALPRSDRL